MFFSWPVTPFVIADALPLSFVSLSLFIHGVIQRKLLIHCLTTFLPHLDFYVHFHLVFMPKHHLVAFPFYQWVNGLRTVMWFAQNIQLCNGKIRVLFYFIVLLFICAHNVWVISPSCLHPLPYHPLHPLPLPPTPSIPCFKPRLFNSCTYSLLMPPDFSWCK
jgi:hypothetical protein